jgi:hypothetical protein
METHPFFPSSDPHGNPWWNIPASEDPDTSRPQPGGYPKGTPITTPGGGQFPFPTPWSEWYEPGPGGTGGPSYWRPYYPHPILPEDYPPTLQPGLWPFPPGWVQDKPGGQPYILPGFPGGPAGPPIPWIERPAPGNLPWGVKPPIAEPIPDGGPYNIPGKFTRPLIT